MGAPRRADGTVVSEWDPPEIPSHTYAGCVYCTAPVDISRQVDQAVVDALIAIASALEEVPMQDVLKVIDDCIGQMTEIIRTDLDESLPVKEMRELRFAVMDARLEAASGAARKSSGGKKERS